MLQPAITIITPVLNGEKYIKNCLDSVFAQSFKNFEVVIFDNGSKDKTVEIAKNYPVKIIENKNNIGWAKANNLCIKQAKTKYVFLLNIDTILEPDCLKNLYEFAESKNDLACVSPRIVEYSDFVNGNIDKGYPLIFDIKDGLIKAYSTNSNCTEVSFVPGTALFANLENLRDNLYFREDFFIYHEDVELSLRILTTTRLALYFLNTSIVAHDSKQSFSKISTCRLAIRNLFTCLATYQSRKEFLTNYGAYIKNFFKMYKDFYYQYYPFAYPAFGIFYLATTVLKLNRQTNFDLKRLHLINRKMGNHHKQFEFVF